MLRNRLVPFGAALLLCWSAGMVHGQDLGSRYTAREAQNLSAIAQTPCTSGSAGGYACNGVDLMAFMPVSTIGGGTMSDVWGWTDPQTNREYAIAGRSNGTAFVDITDPANPIYLGNLPTQTSSNWWRDMKVYKNHAFIVADGVGNHGIQVFDLTRLRSVASPPVTFTPDARYTNVGSVHNIAINEDTGFAYAIGTSSGGTTCAGGLHIVNIQNPKSPTFAGCYSADGYTHDTQCVIYHGPDTAYQGKEICFSANEDTVTLVDVTNKSVPTMLSREGYPSSAYVHQGWLTDDHKYFYQNDELDRGNTRTFVWDVQDLNSPMLVHTYTAANPARDHNLYVQGNFAFEANYASGLRIIDISDRTSPKEVGFFDTYTPNDNFNFEGAWSTYPYFPSGSIIVTSISEGLFILRRTSSTPPPPAFTITLIKHFITTTGVKVAKVKWTPANVSTGKVDFYVNEAPDGTYLRRTANDGNDKIKLKTNQFPGNGPYTIQACEKNSTTVCSNILSVDWASALVDLAEADEDGEEVEEAGKGAELPEAFALQGNYPNPFNPTTSIRMDLPASALVRVEVYDMLGRLVLTTPEVSLSAGTSRSVDVDGSTLSSGSYIYRVFARMDQQVQVATGNMVLVK